MNNVKAVLTCGHPDSGHEGVHELLVAAGLRTARNSRSEGVSAQQVHDRLFAACAGEPGSRQIDVPLMNPGNIWQELASDLVQGNLGGNWGFADDRTVWLLNFWKDIDPGVRFVLVYCAPEQVAGKRMEGRSSRALSLQEQLESWQSVHDELLRFYLRNPDRCVLVEAFNAVQQPELTLETISKALEVELTTSARIGRAEPPVSRVASWLARSVTADNRQAVALYNELESAADLASPAPDRALEKEQLAQEYEAMLQTLQANVAAQASQEAEIANLARHNELLALQVNQLYEEATAEGKKSSTLADLREAAERRSSELSEQINRLEQHFTTEIAAAKQAVPPPRSRPVEVVYDFRNPVEGENWYPAEENGRWAGPGLVSTLRVEPLQHGLIEVELDVMDAMDPGIVERLRVAVNGTWVEAGQQWQGFPTKIAGRFASQAIPEAKTWEIQLHFPQVISPSERGSSDRRSLAVRVGALRLRSFEPGPGSLN